jgi:deferrochelatase/peroxidase EfeB
VKNILSAAPGLQEGIYYAHKDRPGNSFAVVFLRAVQPVDVLKLRRSLSNIWKRYQNLKEVLVADLKVDGKDSYHRTLTVLFGYGPRFFELNEIAREKPKYLNKEWLFLTPGAGRAPIIPDTGLKYADDMGSNEVADDHLIIQFIGDTQLATHRAVVETWKFLKEIENDELCAPLVMRSFYTGFNRPDGRSWLGFHDGVSNVKSTDRIKVILTDKKALDSVDNWTSGGGTYMAYLRIGVDLNNWESIPTKEQERIVGRQKTSGCPLAGTDQYGNNVFSPGCPVKGTHQITEDANYRFREYEKSYHHPASTRVSVSAFENSHVGRMVKTSERIFRQGYEFLESIQTYPYFRVGLNFVSFQGGTDRIYRSIKYGFRRVNFGGDPSSHIPGTENLLSVYAAGLFLVPPFNRRDNFPGDVIFNKEQMVSLYGESFSASKLR